MRRLLGFGLLAVGVTGAVAVGARLAGAVGELASVAGSVEISHAGLPALESLAIEPSPLEIPPPAAVAPPEAVSDAGSDADRSLFEENELALEYFGSEVSLNDLGQLQSPDREFDRAIRALANERGEIDARD